MREARVRDTSWCRSSGPKLDDDIVSTAGRLADAADEPGEEPPKLEMIYVFELPLTVPLDAPPPKERLEAAEAALRAREGGGGGVRDGRGRRPSLVPARDVGAGIVAGGARAQRRADRDGGRAADAGCAAAPVLGGVGGSRPPEIGRGHRVRAQEGALPGAADGAAARGSPSASIERAGGPPGRRPGAGRIRPMFILIVGGGRVGLVAGPLDARGTGTRFRASTRTPRPTPGWRSGSSRRGRTRAVSSRSGRRWRSRRSRRPGSSRRTPSSPPPTATTPTS